MSSRYLVFFLLILAVLVPHRAQALTGSQVYERVRDSVVVVKAYGPGGHQVGLGSGVVLPSGLVVTNHHVAKDGVRLTVSRGQLEVPALRVTEDSERDLCLLQVFGLKATPARLGQAGSLKVGDRVFAVGAPYGLELSVSEGIVSQLRGGPPPVIQTTAAISPGSSGGGLFNDQGKLVGITTFYLKDSQGVNFALPVEWVEQLASKVDGKRRKEEPPRAAAPGAKPKEDRLEKSEGLSPKVLNALVDFLRHRTQAEPDDVLAWFSLGFVYGKLGRNQDELEAYREALRLKPDYAEAWHNLGVVYGKLGRHQEAVEAYREALRLKPDLAEAWNNLAIAYALSGNRSAALQAVRELRRYDPQQADELFDFIMGR